MEEINLKRILFFLIIITLVLAILVIRAYALPGMVEGEDYDQWLEELNNRKEYPEPQWTDYAPIDYEEHELLVKRHCWIIDDSRYWCSDFKMYKTDTHQVLFDGKWLTKQLYSTNQAKVDNAQSWRDKIENITGAMWI